MEKYPALHLIGIGGYLSESQYKLCVWMRAREPDELWKPILDLGGEGHYWVEDFLMEWFIKGIGTEKVSIRFY